MNLVMKEVDRIEKDAKHALGYEYASEKIIKETFHPLFAKYGILPLISSSNPRFIPTTYTQKGVEVSNNVFALDINYKFYDIESGEFLEGTFVGTGNGKDDKGNYAAVTGAIKYILTSTFVIPTGDDPEKDDTPPAPKAKVVQARMEDINIALDVVRELPSSDKVKAAMVALESAIEGKTRLSKAYVDGILKRAKELQGAS